MAVYATVRAWYGWERWVFLKITSHLPRYADAMWYCEQMMMFEGSGNFQRFLWNKITAPFKQKRA
jgi:hypothetical protein